MLARAAWRFAAGSGLGIGVVGTGYLVNWDPAEATHLLQIVPRTSRLVAWAGQALFRHHLLVAASPGGDIDPVVLQQQRRLDAAELREVCRRNGGIYVKATQFASNLLSVPEDYRAELGRLLNSCKSITLQEVRSIIEAETGRPLEATYAWISEEPVATASLAQVHLARLHDGRNVAIKVQYPGAALAVAADLRVCSMFASVYAWLGGEHVAAARNILRDLSTRLRHEVDFLNEIENSRRLRSKLATPGVTVPEIFDHLSSKRLLTMEWIEGVRIDDVGGLQRAGLDVKAVGSRFLTAVADMLYVQGDLHGDLHPGNVLVRGSGDLFEIVLLDHGWYVQLPDTLRKQYCRLWCAFVLKDAAMAEAVANEIAGPHGSRVVPEVLSLVGLLPGNGQGRRHALQKAKKEEPSASGRAPFSLPGGLESLNAIRYFPTEVVEILRASQAARNIGESLGCFAADRLAINAKAALTGLAVETDSLGRVRHWSSKPGVWEEWRLSLQLGARIRLLRALLWCKNVKKYLEACWFALYHTSF